MTRTQVSTMNSSTNMSTPPTKKPAGQFNELEVIRHPDGVVAVITERIRDGRVSFMIAREYDVDGEVKRSAYIARRHLPAARMLINDLEERLELAEDRARAKKR